ncbi:hypothetical protein JZ751_008678 [Albula glossodonta]|uniref:Uncharacterized protein n=1 Tax=Albula glossodonta TaxID=121402 RepID=A0A8T2NZD7_9TELE|nr:hypothetical protein JZ751_008678 [Albula glossodonta]
MSTKFVKSLRRVRSDKGKAGLLRQPKQDPWQVSREAFPSAVPCETGETGRVAAGGLLEAGLQQEADCECKETLRPVRLEWSLDLELLGKVWCGAASGAVRDSLKLEQLPVWFWKRPCQDAECCPLVHLNTKPAPFSLIPPAHSLITQVEYALPGSALCSLSAELHRHCIIGSTSCEAGTSRLDAAGVVNPSSIKWMGPMVCILFKALFHCVERPHILHPFKTLFQCAEGPYAMEELVSELRLFLDLLDREYLSPGVREKKLLISNILHRVLAAKGESCRPKACGC